MPSRATTWALVPLVASRNNVSAKLLVIYLQKNALYKTKVHSFKSAVSVW